jgi:Arc/MetJ family transcription regulator
VRTNIVIEDELMAAAMNASGLGTKREVVEAGLRLLVKLKAQENIRRYRGKLAWEGDHKRQRGLR